MIGRDLAFNKSNLVGYVFMFKSVCERRDRAGHRGWCAGMTSTGQEIRMMWEWNASLVLHFLLVKMFGLCKREKESQVIIRLEQNKFWTALQKV